MTNFENRYPFEVKIGYSEDRIKEIRENYRKISIQNIQSMRKIQGRPKTIEYFEQSIFDQAKRIEELKAFKASGGKLVGVFCIQVPDELIYSAGAVPIRLSCGFYDSISAGEEIVPKNTCPLIRSSVGFNFLKINPIFELCDVIIIPTTCDGKKKMADILSNYLKVWTLELPNDKDNPASRDYWVDQVKILKEKLENLTGKTITKNILREKIELLQKRTALVRKFFDLRKNKLITITGRDAYLIMQVAFFDDINRWMTNLSKVTTEMEQMINSNKSIVPIGTSRIFMTGSALIWPNMKILHIIEQTGAVVVADDSCACGQYFYNPVEVDEWSMKAMIEGISDKYLLPTVCPIFIHSDDRVDRILELVNQYKADGVAYHILRLCCLFDFEFKKIGKVLEKKNMPLLKIETEYSEEDVGQIKTRVEAFIEMIKSRKEQ